MIKRKWIYLQLLVNSLIAIGKKIAKIYFFLVTEEEINHGILSNATKMTNRALVFMREIHNYENISFCSENEINLGKKFFELDDYNKIDRQIEKKIKDLKKKVIEKIDENFVLKYNVETRRLKIFLRQE